MNIIKFIKNITYNTICPNKLKGKVYIILIPLWLPFIQEKINVSADFNTVSIEMKT